MAAKALPDPELLRKLLRYEPETGKLFWRERSLDMFPRKSRGKSWNARYAGVEAFKANSPRGFRTGSLFGRTFKAHRVIWAIVHGFWPPEDIDHINGNPSDNRLSNLRAVSHAENLKNQKLRNTNTSGVVGVIWHKQRGKWNARIMHHGRNISLGCFYRFEDAAAARFAAEKRLGFHKNHGRR